jgi:hypothetical protein
MISNNFQKYIDTSGNGKEDFRSFAEKARGYISHLAVLAKMQKVKFVKNALDAARHFPEDNDVIVEQVHQIETRLGGRITKLQMENSNHLPCPDTFKNGVINTGTVLDADVEAKLPVDKLSGNVVIYGQYGMGKTNFNLRTIPQLVTQGVHVNIFDVGTDFRDLLQLSKCSGGLVLTPETDRLNPLEPIGNPEEHLQFFWEITRQDFNLRDETKEMLFNYSNQLYKEFGVYEGKPAPTLFDLKEFLEKEREKKSTSLANKNKIRTALEKLNYILISFGKMVNCRSGYSLEQLDKFPLVIYEIGDLSEDKRSWYMKLKLKQYYHKGMLSKDRHKVHRIIVIDEAKGIFGKSRIGEATNYIKDMFTRSRAIGCWWIISDQFTSELADFVRAASCQICFQHSVPKESREIATAMGGDETVRQGIHTLGRFKAYEKIVDFPYPYIIITHKSEIERHINQAELDSKMKPKVAMISYQSVEKKEIRKARLISRANVGVPKKEVEKKVSLVTVKKENPLSDLTLFLRYIFRNPGRKVSEIYKAIQLSGRRGNNVKMQAKDNELISEKMERCSGKGRPSLRLELTGKGKEYIDEKHKA